MNNTICRRLHWNQRQIEMNFTRSQICILTNFHGNYHRISHHHAHDGSISCGNNFLCWKHSSSNEQKKEHVKSWSSATVYEGFSLDISLVSFISIFISSFLIIVRERQHHPSDKWMKFCVTWHYEIDNVSLPHTLVHSSRSVSRWQTMSTRERENNITFPFSVNFHFCQLV